MWRALEILRADENLCELDLLVFDGFDLMQSIQKEFIGLASEQVPEVIVTLTYDSSRPEVFGAVEETREFLLGLGAEETRLSADAAGDSLHALRRSIFTAEPEKSAPDDTVTLLEAGSPTIELEMIAGEIKKLSRDGGVRLSEIAVVARDIHPYRDRIERALRAAGVAVESAGRPLAETSCARLLVTAIDCITGGWGRPEVCRMLKSDLLGGELGQACRAEVDAKQLGIIDGRDNWLRLWGESDGTHEFRAATLAPVVRFEESLGSVRSAEGCAGVVRELVAAFATRSWSGELLAEDSAAKRAFEAIFDDIVRTEKLIGRPIGGEQFLALVRDSISRAELPTRRRSADAVRLRSASALGGQQFRAVFLIGLLEKVFPRQIREESFLRDHERRVLAAGLDHKLAERLPMQSTERFLFYSALAAATECVFLSYPTADESAKDSLPSFYIDEAKKVFAGDPVTRRRDISNLVCPVDYAQTPRELARAVVLGLARTCEAAEAAYHSYPAESFGVFARAFGECEDKCASIAGDKLLHHLGTSRKRYRCTELEAYAACPFMHYCGSVLALEPVREEVGALDLGGILHEVMFQLFSGLRAEHGNELDLGALDKEATIERALVILDAEYKKNSRILGLPAHESETQFAMLKGYVERYLSGELSSPRKGFVPSHFELEFGSPAVEGRNRDSLSNNKPLVISDNETRAELCGKIDRVDEVFDGALVIDYKLGETDAKEFGKGLVFQFMVYALALERVFGMTPVGAEYRTLKKWHPEGYYSKESGISSRTRTKSPEEWHEMLAKCEAMVLSVVRDMRAGRIAVEPLDCKSYCSFKGVCRIDNYKMALLKMALGGEDVEEAEL
jgi:ATP-dependent helicase/DNAse subunit B